MAYLCIDATADGAYYFYAECQQTFEICQRLERATFNSADMWGGMEFDVEYDADEDARISLSQLRGSDSPPDSTKIVSLPMAVEARVQIDRLLKEGSESTAGAIYQQLVS